MFSLCNYWSLFYIFKCFVSVRDLTWRLRWAAPPSGPHPEHGCGSEISWEPRPTPCPGSPFHPPHSWHIRGQTEQNEWNQFVPVLQAVSSWPRFYHGGYVSIYKRGCYEGFLVRFVPWVILITWRIFMNWVCRSFVLCRSLFIKLLIAMAPPHVLVQAVFFCCCACGQGSSDFYPIIQGLGTTGGKKIILTPRHLCWTVSVDCREILQSSACSAPSSAAGSEPRQPGCQG